MFPCNTFLWKNQETDVLEFYLSIVKGKQKSTCCRQSMFTEKMLISGWAENPLVTPIHSTYFPLLE